MRRRVFGTLAICVAPVLAGSAAAVQAPGAELTVYLATYDAGDQVWEKFGHNAIWIHDSTTGSTISYNYGMFSFDQPAFVPRLMKGRMLYAMDVRAAEEEVAAYQYYNRSVTAQRLNMSSAQKHTLREFLEWNWAQDSGRYLYDYFRDNCSTRIRDALDRALGGQLRAALEQVPVASTYRSESLRLTAGSPATYTGLLIGLGMPTDQPLTAWQETFIPMRLQEHIRSVQVMDEHGRVAPLVLDERAVFTAPREAAPAVPPSRTLHYLVAGLLAAAGLVGLSYAGRTRRLARVGLALALSVWGIVTGFLGLILLLLWLLTDHTAAYPNLNLLQLNPLALVLAVAAPLALGTRRYAVGRAARPLALVVAALSALGLVLLLIPGLYQANGPLIALLLPMHAAVVLCLYQNPVHQPSSPEDVSGRVAWRAAA